MLRQDRHRNHAIAIARVNGRRKSASLAAEHQHDIARRAERHVPEQSSPFRGEEVWLAKAREPLLEFLPTVPDAEVHVRPIVEPCSSQLALVERESERLHQMQHRAGGKTRASGIAGVPVNLGMNEHDVERQDYRAASRRQRDRDKATTSATINAGAPVRTGNATSARWRSEL